MQSGKWPRKHSSLLPRAYHSTPSTEGTAGQTGPAAAQRSEQRLQCVTGKQTGRCKVVSQVTK